MHGCTRHSHGNKLSPNAVSATMTYNMKHLTVLRLGPAWRALLKFALADLARKRCAR